MSQPHSHTHASSNGHDSHDHSGHGHDHSGHGHEHDAPADSTPASLHAQIDFPNVVALNASSAATGRAVIKPHHQREDETVYVESDADDQLILRVPFTANVKLKSVMIKSGPGENTAEKVLLFPNEDGLDFDDVQDKKPAQELEIVQTREAVEYQVRASKFNSCRSLTLFFPSAVGGDTTRIYYVGFYGEWQPLSDQPVIAVYEANTNLADHIKIQGTEQGMDFNNF